MLFWLILGNPEHTCIYCMYILYIHINDAQATSRAFPLASSPFGPGSWKPYIGTECQPRDKSLGQWLKGSACQRCCEMLGMLSEENSAVFWNECGLKLGCLVELVQLLCNTIKVASTDMSPDP